MFYQTLLSPHVKQSEIITDKHGMFHLPYQLPKDSELRILEN